MVILLKKYYKILSECPLFKSMSYEDIDNALRLLYAEPRYYSKNSYIYSAGSCISKTGIVLSGKIQIISEDFWGNRSLIACADAGELFAEAFVCAEEKIIPVSVFSAENCEILFLDLKKIMQIHSECNWYKVLLNNMIYVLAQKNLILMKKIQHISQKTIREKLISYLSNEAFKNKSDTFTVSLNRQQMAEYLSADRSALSAELSKMQKERIIEYSKNKFRLIKK